MGASLMKRRSNRSAEAREAKTIGNAQRRIEVKKKARRSFDAPSNKMFWQLLVGTFIVAKSTPRETAPLLDFLSLQAANMTFYTQNIHKWLWAFWG
jgi:hypothetical protein